MHFKIYSFVFLAIFPFFVNGHGMVTDPVNRATRWRVDPTAVPNYTDNGLFCGGFSVQWDTNNGKCGMCGDSYSDPTPREHELGGTYGQGTIVKSYTEGSQIPITVRISANHKGFFQFRLCNIDKFGMESDECFDDVLLLMPNGSDRHVVEIYNGDHFVNLQLPKGLVCQHCVLQWTYTTGNRWDICENGVGASGCGPQETFRTCSDISIVP